MSVTIHQDFPGEASHCKTFAILLSRVFSCSLPKDIFLLLIFEISRKSVESAYPINSLKVDVFLLKSYARFLLVKVPNQLAPHLETMTPDKTGNQWNNGTSECL